MIDWAVSARPLAGERRSGDAHVVAPFPGGVLLGVVDGLGHGDEAGIAADRAVEALETSADEPVELLVRRCHEELRGTRGAVMTLASLRLSDCTMTWLAVGNVEAVVVRSSIGRARIDHVVSRGGIVGYSLPPLVASATSVDPSDVLILATDGIRPGFTERAPGDGSLDGPPGRIADRIVERYAQDNDDALVLVARLGDESP
jgi:hypothetical protein